jgi:hypothetical protein
MGVKEAFNRSFFSVTDLEQRAEETTKIQVGNIAEAVQQLQARVA